MMIDNEYVKGNIYFDKSFKDMFWGKVRNHQEYRADVVYNGQRYRKRSKNYRDCELFLLALKNENIGEYLRTCDWCGSTFERTAHNGTSRYCCPACASMAAKKRAQKSCGMYFTDEHGRRISPPKPKYKGG